VLSKNSEGRGDSKCGSEVGSSLGLSGRNQMGTLSGRSWGHEDMIDSGLCPNGAGSNKE